MTIQEDVQKEILKIAFARLKFNIEYAEKMLFDEELELTEDEKTGGASVAMLDATRGASTIYDLVREPLDVILMKLGSLENYITFIDKCARRFKEAIKETDQDLTQRLARLTADPEDN